LAERLRGVQPHCDRIVTKHSAFLSARFSPPIQAVLSILRTSEWAAQIGPGTELHVHPEQA